jgi:coproporphyrinogen III oxidase-like Fe-S oxidoreductase
LRLRHGTYKPNQQAHLSGGTPTVVTRNGMSEVVAAIFEGVEHRREIYRSIGAS